MRSSLALIIAAIALLAATVMPGEARAFYNLRVGEAVPGDALPTLKGGEDRLWVEGMEVSVFVFFKPDQENSVRVLRDLAKLPEELKEKKLHLVAVCSSEYDTEKVEEVLEDTGFSAPVMIDLDDEFYGKLGAVLTPALGIVSAEGTLVHYQPFQKINYLAVVRGRILHHLGDIDDAALQKILEPPKATQGGDAAVARRRVNMGRMLLLAKKLEKALKMADEAIDLDSGNASAFGLRAAILAADEKCRSARKSMEKAFALDPDDKLAKQAEAACPAGGAKAPEKKAGKAPEKEAGKAPEKEAGKAPEKKAEKVPEKEADSATGESE